MQLPVVIDEHGFTGPDIAQEFEAQGIECHALRGDHVLDAETRLPTADDGRTDAVAVAKRHDAVADDHRHHRIPAAAAPMHSLYGAEDVVDAEAAVGNARQFMGEDVEQYLGIRPGVEVAPVLVDEQLGKLGCVGQIAVVAQADTERRVDIEGLGL